MKCGKSQMEQKARKHLIGGKAPSNGFRDPPEKGPRTDVVKYGQSRTIQKEDMGVLSQGLKAEAEKFWRTVNVDGHGYVTLTWLKNCLVKHKLSRRLMPDVISRDDGLTFIDMLQKHMADCEESNVTFDDFYCVFVNLKGVPPERSKSKSGKVMSSTIPPKDPAIFEGRATKVTERDNSTLGEEKVKALPEIGENSRKNHNNGFKNGNLASRSFSDSSLSNQAWKGNRPFRVVDIGDLNLTKHADEQQKDGLPRVRDKSLTSLNISSESSSKSIEGRSYFVFGQKRGFPLSTASSKSASILYSRHFH